MVLPVIGSLVSAGLDFAGGMMNREENRKHNEAQIRQAELNRQMQLDFAKQGIRWKVDDAKAAGIHPLYALGAQTTSYSPVSLGGGPDSSLGNAMAAAGQDVSRAMNATRTQDERETAYTKTVQNLTLQKMGLENDLLASQVAKLRASPNPALPAGKGVPTASEFEEAPKLVMGGQPITANPNSANAEDFEKRFGEVGQFIAGLNNMWQDYKATTGGFSGDHWINHKLFGKTPWIVPGGIVDRVRRRFDKRHSSGW